MLCEWIMNYLKRNCGQTLVVETWLTEIKMDWRARGRCKETGLYKLAGGFPG